MSSETDEDLSLDSIDEERFASLERLVILQRAAQYSGNPAEEDAFIAATESFRQKFGDEGIDAFLSDDDDEDDDEDEDGADFSFKDLKRRARKLQDDKEVEEDLQAADLDDEDEYVTADAFKSINSDLIKSTIRKRFKPRQHASLLVDTEKDPIDIIEKLESDEQAKSEKKRTLRDAIANAMPPPRIRSTSFDELVAYNTRLASCKAPAYSGIEPFLLEQKNLNLKSRLSFDQDITFHQFAETISRIQEALEPSFAKSLRSKSPKEALISAIDTQTVDPHYYQLSLIDRCANIPVGLSFSKAVQALGDPAASTTSDSSLRHFLALYNLIIQFPRPTIKIVKRFKIADNLHASLLPHIDSMVNFVIQTVLGTLKAVPQFPPSTELHSKLVDRLVVLLPDITAMELVQSLSILADIKMPLSSAVLTSFEESFLAKRKEESISAELMSDMIDILRSLDKEPSPALVNAQHSAESEYCPSDEDDFDDFDDEDDDRDEDDRDEDDRDEDELRELAPDIDLDADQDA